MQEGRRENRGEGRGEGEKEGGEGKIHERMLFEESGGIVPLLYFSTAVV